MNPYAFVNFAKLWESKDKIWYWNSNLKPLHEVKKEIEIMRPKADLNNIELINQFTYDG